MTKKKQKKRQNKEINREYTNILLIFTGIFVLMTGYLILFQASKSREVINNPYNARLETFEERVVRGSILASDGQELAYTQVEAGGSERRVYPFGCTFAHVLGYSEYGKTGIENIGNFQLLTSNAYFVEKFINELKEQKNIGDNLVTTLDVELQTIAHDALSTHKGAVIVMEPSTGNVRALISKPDYDPGEIVSRWQELSHSKDSTLLNRAMQGLYPPGSVFKTVTLLEYLREHQLQGQDYSYVCEGKVKVGNSAISCYHGKKHGELDLTAAFARSCNSAFADMGRKLDISAFQDLTGQLLFDSELPLEFPYSKSSFKLSDEDPEVLQMMTAIGQGDTLVTPVHMAMLVSAIANDGVLMEPRFLERTESYTGTLVEKYPVTAYGSLMTPEEAELLQGYMEATVEDGTASALKSDRYTAAGKTGTAEYSSDKSRSHAWFIGYVTGDRPDLAVCVLVEGVGSGSEYAVPIAEKIFDAYYAE
ncbi:MAG: penicillin-binding protein 2 [Clostridiales bacterium]|nr:penicillin-binding protein 2 [Clostridiales bacterium]